MAEHEKEKDPSPSEPPAQEGGKEPSKEQGKGGSATATAKPKKKTKPKNKPPGMLPPWKVLLHNDDKNDMGHVVDTIVELTPLNKQDATIRTEEAHKTGVSLLLTTHKERAELYQEQFQSKSLTVTIEPAE